MNPKLTFKRSPSGHIRFESKSAAIRYGECERKEKLTSVAVIRHVNSSLKRGIHLKPYLCRHCGNWHVTSMIRK